MAKQKKPPRETPSSADSAPKPKSSDSQTARLDAVEVNAPLISSEVGATIVPSQMEGSYLTVDSRMDSSDTTVIFLVKEAPELVFHDIVDSSGESGARRIAIPLHYLTTSMGFTLLISYKGRASGQPAASLVKEVGISFYPASESKNLAPYLLHEETVNNTPTYDMKYHTGDETVLVPVPPLAKAGDKVYCTAVTEQDAIPYVFYTVIYGHVLSPEEAVDGYVLKFFIARGWLARRKPWRSITLQCAWITSSLAAEPPAEVDPRLETRLPRNALEIQHRRTAALIVDPGIENLPPPHLQQSVFYNDEWCLNPELTRDGGDVDASNLDTYAGDRVCFFVTGPGYARKQLDCVVIEQDGDRASVKLPACTVACFFNKPMTLSYTLAFGESELPSPDRVVNVLVPQFPRAQIEEATNHTVDLGAFSGDATATVPAWAYGECSKLCWMWVTGKGEDGRDLRFDLLSGAPVTDDWKARGVETPLSRVDLQKLADCSDFDLHFAASFCEASDLVDAQEFLVHRFNIQQVPLVLPPPSVPDATERGPNDYVLRPVNAVQGATVRVAYDDTCPDDQVCVYWEGGPGDGTPPVPCKEAGDQDFVDFAIPASAATPYLEDAVRVHYTVTRKCKTLESPPCDVSRLPRPALPDLIFDLGDFCARDPEITAEPWMMISTKNKVRLECRGFLEDGTPTVLPLVQWESVTESEVTNGWKKAMPHDVFMQLCHRSEVTFVMQVLFDGDPAEELPTTFPLLTTTLIHRFVQTEGFDGQPNKFLADQEKIELSTMTITMIDNVGRGGGIVTFPAVPPYLTGPAIVTAYQLSGMLHRPQKLRLDFTNKCKCVRFAAAHIDGHNSVGFRFLNDKGELLHERWLPSPPRHLWIEFDAPQKEHVKTLEIDSVDYAFFDNFTLIGSVE
ncbi:hypothetical protein KHP07_22885 [Pseudomonas sp. VS40]|uniref:hypothetical protein n=1 Tax=unclassified Pseudomonas TaxID=196821 RepID=UPI001BDEF8A6|nr:MULTISPECIES: hypothetical protein [unclassified Pseudomonas]MBT1263220.1 hypothetical protein [Pseudomonas sp. VS40]MBT1275195.1 hypothetical protein [Pseudomonas sp. VS59]